ncbi:MAG TPA: hypothetical protein VLE93_03345 [Candidatus Saccharimonadales bacterium]|nr:hypothetical protein [Candidatus Saccharimonadales bacterium]
MALCRLSALLDDYSEWGGRSLVEDKLFDRYSSIGSYHRGHRVSCRLHDSTGRRRSDGYTLWEVSIQSVPDNPDNLSRGIVTAFLKFSVFNGAWEMLNLIVALHELARQPVPV